MHINRRSKSLSIAIVAGVLALGAGTAHARANAALYAVRPAPEATYWALAVLPVVHPEPLIHPPREPGIHPEPPSAPHNEERPGQHTNEPSASNHSERPNTSELNAADQAALTEYTGWGYNELNDALRRGNPSPAQRERIDAVAAALTKLPDYRGEVYREANLTGPEIAVYEAGKIITEPAFTSTYADSRAMSGNTEWVIESRSGKSIAEHSDVPNENEILFAPGTQFKVTSVDKKTSVYHDSVTVIHMTEI